LKSMQLSITSSPFDGTQLCSTENPDLFFPDNYQEDLEQIKRAKAICSNCWIEKDCLKFAMKTKQRYGIWGGTTPNERKRLRKLDVSRS